MPVLNIQGKRVTVGDEFLSLSPEEQNDTVDEIAASMSISAEPQKNEDGFDTSGDSSYPVMGREDTAGKASEVDGQSFDAGGVPLGGNKNTEVLSEEDAPGYTAAPSGTLNEVTDEEGNITSRAYDGLQYGDALKVYEALANHPDAEVSKSAIPGGLDTIIFRGKRVPVPEPAMFGKGARVSSVQLGGEEIIQTATNIADLITSGANLGIEAATGAQDVIPQFDRPNIEKEGFIDNIAAEGPVLAATGGVGLKAANTLVGGNVAKLAGPTGSRQIAEGIIKRYSGNTGGIRLAEKAAIRGAGVNTGMVAGMDNDASGVFTGDDAAISDAIDILSVDPKTGSRSAEILSNKVNLLADAAATGMVASGLANTLGLAKKLVYDGVIKRIATFGSDSMQERRVIEEMLVRTGNLSADANPGELKQYAEEVANIIRSNKDVLARTPDGGIDVELDPLAALASALENSNNKIDQVAGSRARTLRNDIYGANLPEPNIRQAEYQEQLDEFGDELYNAGGGREGVESARSGIVQAGRDEVAGVRATADAAQLDVERNSARIEQIFKMDATVGQKLAALEKEGVDINIYRRGNEALETTVTRIAAGERQLRGARDAAYKALDDAIPEGVPLGDAETFDRLMTDAGNLLPPSLVNRYQNMDINDLKSVRKEILPAVDRALNMTDKGSAQYQALKDLKDNINVTQLELLDPGVKAGIKDAKDAVDVANREYYNWFERGALSDVAQSQRSVGKFKISDGEGGTTSVPNRAAELTEADRSNSTIDSLFTNQNRNGLQLVGEFLQTPEGGRNAKPLVDIGIAKIVQNSRKTAQTGGVGEIDSQALISSLGNFSAALEKVAPKQYARLEAIITNLRKHEKNGVELERIAKEAETLAKDTEKSVLDGELTDFFNRSGTARQEITQGQEVFNGIFSNAKMFDQKVDNIITRAEQSGPEARNGLKAAFGKFIKFNENDIKNNGERTLDIANRIYADQPEVVEAIETAFKLTDMVRIGKGSRADIGTMGSTVAQEGQAGITKAITMLFGVLNPVATRVRTISSIATGNFDPRDNMIRLVGEIASDTPRFLELLDDYVATGTFNDPKRLFDFMVKAGIYSNTDEDYATFAERLEQEEMNQGGPDEVDNTIELEPEDPEEDFLR